MKNFTTLLLIILGIFLIFSYYLIKQKDTNSVINKQIISLQQQMSGFYTQIENLKNENEKLVENRKDLIENNNYDNGILEIIQNLFEKKYNITKDNFNVSIIINSENHIKGTIFIKATKEEAEQGFSGQGGNFLATKINNIWEIIFDGNGSISCNEMQKYNFPQNMQENFCFE